MLSVAIAATCLITIASPTYAIDVAPAPSAAFAEGTAPQLTPVDGLDEVIATPLVCDLLCNITAQSPRTAAAGDCANCYARNRMSWTDHWQYEDVQIGFSKNTSDESIYRQNLHAALMSSGSNQCYSGSYRYSANVSDVYNVANSPVISSSKYRAWDDKWTLASGHLWDEDGVIWTVSGGADICKQF